MENRPVHTFAAAVKFTGSYREEEIFRRLYHNYSPDYLLAMCRKANSIDNSMFGFVRVRSFYEIFEFYDNDVRAFAQAIIDGDCFCVDDWFYFYHGMLTTISENGLESEACDHDCEIAEWLMDNWEEVVNILHAEDVELFEAWDVIDRANGLLN